MRKTILIVIGLLLTLSLFACIQPISEVVSLEVENWPTDDLKTAGSVDLADVNVIVNYSNDTQDTLSLDQVSVQSDSIVGTILTVNFGTNTVKISYGGLSLMLTFQAYPDMITVGSEGTIYTFDSNLNDNETVTGGYSLSATEVTYAQWYSVRMWAEDHGYEFFYPDSGREGNDGVNGASPTSNSNEPVTSLTWTDSIVWLNALSEIMGLDAVYRDIDNNIIRNSKSVLIDVENENYQIAIDESKMVGKNGYRLPSNGEWQMAARWRNIDGNGSILVGGRYWTPGNYASGASDSTAEATGAVAWYSGNSGNTTHPVGEKTPNHLGLYDMSGNVNEFCYTKSGTGNYNYVNSWGFATSYSEYNKLDSTGTKLRYMARTVNSPNAYDDIGFRIAQGAYFEAATPPISFELSEGNNAPRTIYIFNNVSYPIMPLYTDSTGKVWGLKTDGSDTLIFSVDDSPESTSSITIGGMVGGVYVYHLPSTYSPGNPYQSGTEFTLPQGTTKLHITVTTSQVGKEDKIYSFSIDIKMNRP